MIHNFLASVCLSWTRFRDRLSAELALLLTLGLFVVAGCHLFIIQSLDVFICPIVAELIGVQEVACDVVYGREMLRKDSGLGLLNQLIRREAFRYVQLKQTLFDEIQIALSFGVESYCLAVLYLLAAVPPVFRLDQRINNLTLQLQLLINCMDFQAVVVKLILLDASLQINLLASVRSKRVKLFDDLAPLSADHLLR